MERILQYMESLQARMQALVDEMDSICQEMNALKEVCEACHQEKNMETIALSVAAVAAAVENSDAAFLENEAGKIATLVDFPEEFSEMEDLSGGSPEIEKLIEVSFEIEELPAKEEIVESEFEPEEAIMVETEDEPEEATKEESEEGTVEESNDITEAATESEIGEYSEESGFEETIEESEEVTKEETKEIFLQEPAESLAATLSQDRPDSLAEHFEKSMNQKRLQSTLAAQRYADLSKSMSLNERFRYQRELFRNDRDALSQLMAALDTMESWSEAEDYLNAFHWDSELPVVQDFYAMIEQHFNER